MKKKKKSALKRCLALRSLLRRGRQLPLLFINSMLRSHINDDRGTEDSRDRGCLGHDRRIWSSKSGVCSSSDRPAWVKQ